ncbi:hypothetical protein Tco_1414035, partial [Tanacetum coccineum]
EDDAEKDDAKKVQPKEPKETEDASDSYPSSPSNPLPTELKKLEVELPGELKEIPTKLEQFTLTVSSLTTQVAELRTLQWEFLAEFLFVPCQLSSVFERASKKTKDPAKMALTLLRGKRTQTSTPKRSPQLEGEIIKKDNGKKAMYSKDAKEEDIRSDSDEDANMTGSMFESTKKKKLRGQSKITNCDVLTRKGPITLKVYREDRTSEIIPNFKARDLHLAEWREVVKGELDPFDKLNDIARKQRKHANDFHDYFRSTHMFKSSILYEDHPTETMLNEPILGGDYQLCLVEDSSTLVLWVLRRLSSSFTSVYVVVHKLKKILAKASVQLSWQFQAE